MRVTGSSPARDKFFLFEILLLQLIFIIILSFCWILSSKPYRAGDLSLQRQRPYQLVYRTTFPAGVKFRSHDNRLEHSSKLEQSKNASISIEVTSVAV